MSIISEGWIIEIFSELSLELHIIDFSDFNFIFEFMQFCEKMYSCLINLIVFSMAILDEWWVYLFIWQMFRWLVNLLSKTLNFCSVLWITSFNRLRKFIFVCLTTLASPDIFLLSPPISFFIYFILSKSYSLSSTIT